MFSYGEKQRPDTCFSGPHFNVRETEHYGSGDLIVWAGINGEFNREKKSKVLLYKNLKSTDASFFSCDCLSEHVKSVKKNVLLLVLLKVGEQS